MVKFYYNNKYKYTNRTIIDLSLDENFKEIDYVNIDSPDFINAHLIYQLEVGELLPTYVTSGNKRYFVTGITQLRTGKFQLSLLRDIISESDNWKNEEAYVQSGKATDHNKYKRWNLPFTNTKVNEEKLELSGSSSFYVFYVNEQELDSEEGTISEKDLKRKEVSIPGYVGYDLKVNNLNELPNFNLVNAGEVFYFSKKTGTISFYDRFNLRSFPLGVTNGVAHNWTVDGFEERSDCLVPINPFDRDSANDNVFNFKSNYVYAMTNFINNYIKDEFGTEVSTIHLGNVDNYVGKVIYNQADDKFYKVNKTSRIVKHKYKLSKTDTESLLYQIISYGYPSSQTENKYYYYDPVNPYYNFNSHQQFVEYTLEELGSVTSYEFNFTSSVPKLPRSAVRCVNIVPDETNSVNDIMQALMLAQINGINEERNVGRILDIQYLPFSIATETNARFKLNDTNLIAEFISNDDHYFTTTKQTLTNINKETDTIVIVSPSRASQFEFRPYNNDGKMIFNSRVTLRPYQSTIYIRPDTTGLKIYNFDDKDALIISEDYSLTNVTSQWTEYIYQNRNFEKMFEREIQGREHERAWEKTIEKMQKRSDSVTAKNITAQQFQTGVGNLPIISGIAGAIGSGLEDRNYMMAAELDRSYNEAMYQEALSISRDMFSYQNENLQSAPTIPNSITAFDVKSLDGVYLEYYSTNETELAAIDKYYRNNGHRIDDYGTFNQYLGEFVRGKLIRTENYNEPETKELNRRLEIGVFTTPYKEIYIKEEE